MTKAEWKDRDFAKHDHPPERDYVLFKELTLPDGGVIARIEQFRINDRVFYATTPNERSGPCTSYEFARQWAEARSGNKVN